MASCERSAGASISMPFKRRERSSRVRDSMRGWLQDNESGRSRATSVPLLFSPGICRPRWMRRCLCGLSPRRPSPRVRLLGMPKRGSSGQVSAPRMTRLHAIQFRQLCRGSPSAVGALDRSWMRMRIRRIDSSGGAVMITAVASWISGESPSDACVVFCVARRLPSRRHRASNRRTSAWPSISRRGARSRRCGQQIDRIGVIETCALASAALVRSSMIAR